MVLASRPGPVAELTDVECVARAQRGDRDAFTALVERHGAAIYNFVLGLAHDADGAHDIVQDVWTRVAGHLEDLRDVEQFRPWLYRIARNRAMDWHAGWDRCARIEPAAGSDESPADHLADTDRYQPESHLESLDDRRKVWEVLGGLSEVDRTVLFLRDSQELPYAQIADVLGISRGAAEARVCRAREHFRERFARIEEARPSCHTSPLQLSAWVDGETAAEARPALERHIASCDDCTQRVRAIRTGRGLYRAIATFAVPQGTTAAVLARLAELFAGGGAPASIAAGATAASATAVAVAGTAGGGAVVGGIAGGAATGLSASSILGPLASATAAKIAGIAVIASVATTGGASLAPTTPPPSHVAHAPALAAAPDSPVSSTVHIPTAAPVSSGAPAPEATIDEAEPTEASAEATAATQPATAASTDAVPSSAPQREHAPSTREQLARRIVEDLPVAPPGRPNAAPATSAPSVMPTAASLGAQIAAAVATRLEPGARAATAASPGPGATAGTGQPPEIAARLAEAQTRIDAISTTIAEAIESHPALGGPDTTASESVTSADGPPADGDETPAASLGETIDETVASAVAEAQSTIDDALAEAFAGWGQ